MLIFFIFQRDHNQLLLFIIIMGIGVIVSFIQIFQLGFIFLVPSLLSAVCTVYFFICVYSLYKIFKNEKLRQVPNGINSNYETVAL